MDSKTKLRTVGEALYGTNWQTQLAAEMKVADRTMRRWAAGDFEPPPGIWQELAAICRKRGEALVKLADSL